MFSSCAFRKVLKIIYLTFSRSRDSSVGIAMGWTAGVRFPAVKNFSLLHVVQNDSGAHPAHYPMGAGAHSPGGKAAGA
jgi:hypothetical protein